MTNNSIAIRQNELGDPQDTMELVEVDLPAMKAGEVTAELLAAPMNPQDLIPIKEGPPKVPGMQLPSPSFPAFLGREGIARITAVGSDVENVSVGNVVNIPSGVKTWATKLVFPAEGLIKLPEENLVQMSLFALNPMMAYVMIKELADLEQGSWIIQNAANSSIGQYVIQFAKVFGYHTVNVVRREEVKQELLDLGADKVIVDSDSFTEEVRELKIDFRLGLDTVGGDAVNKLGTVLGPKSTLITYGSVSKDYNIVMNRVLFFLKRIELINFYLGNWYQDNREKIGPIRQEIISLIAEGKISSKIGGRFTLEEYQQAFKAAFSPYSLGKIVLVHPDLR